MHSLSLVAELPRSCSFTVVMRSCFYFHVRGSKKSTDPCAALQQPLYGTALFVMASLEQHALVPPPSPPTTGRALRSPGRVRPVILGTASDWPCMMCMIPVWYTCSSKPRTTTSTQASFARLHEQRRAFPPSRSVPKSFCRTWHDPARRRVDPLAMRSICADEVERPWFSRTSIMRGETGHERGLQTVVKRLSRYTSTCAA
jgi:hypothetical protein